MIKQFEGINVVAWQKYQSLLGKLLYLAKVVIPARAFLNRMLSNFRCDRDRQRIVLHEQFC